VYFVASGASLIQPEEGDPGVSSLVAVPSPYGNGAGDPPLTVRGVAQAKKIPGHPMLKQAVRKANSLPVVVAPRRRSLETAAHAFPTSILVLCPECLVRALVCWVRTRHW
jgi:hypothetical protein